MVKTTLANALSQLQEIVSYVELQQDQGLPLDGLDVPFQDASVSVQDAIDRRVHVLKSLAGQVAAAKQSASWWQTKARYLQQALERLEQSTIELGQEEFQGHVSRIKVCVNGGKRPVKFLEELAPSEIKRVVEPKNFPEAYLEKKEIYVLKTDFEEDLREGKITSESAYLAVRGKHLRLS